MLFLFFRFFLFNNFLLHVFSFWFLFFFFRFSSLWLNHILLSTHPTEVQLHMIVILGPYYASYLYITVNISSRLNENVKKSRAATSIYVNLLAGPLLSHWTHIHYSECYFTYSLGFQCSVIKIKLVKVWLPRKMWFHRSGPLNDQIQVHCYM